MGDPESLGEDVGPSFPGIPPSPEGMLSEIAAPLSSRPTEWWWVTASFTWGEAWGKVYSEEAGRQGLGAG